MPRRVTLLVCLLALAAVPSVARAQDQTPFAPLPPAQTSAPQPQVTSSSSSSTGGGGLKSWQEILIFAAGGIMLLGIGWAIVSDARSVAPVEETETQHETRARREAEHKLRKEKQRAANRRARASRKKNR